MVVAWQDQVIDLAQAEGWTSAPEVWTSGSLNAFFALGPDAWARTRPSCKPACDHQPARARRPRREVRLVLPWEVGDYADFYASQEHATNMGRLLRPGTDPLPPPGATCRSATTAGPATVVVSGSTVPRPSGLIGPDGPDADAPEFGPTRRLDVEVEVGFVVGVACPAGRPDTGRGRPTATSSAWSWSTTGAPATSRPSNTNPWGRSSASPSPRRCHRGWCRSPPSSRGGSTARSRTRRRPPTFRPSEPRGFDVQLELSINDHLVLDHPGGRPLLVRWPSSWPI